MKKFRYRLQALLKVKEHLEKERQKELAASTVRVRSQEQKLREVDGHRNTTMDRQRTRIHDRFSVAEMLVITRYLHKLRRDTVVGNELLKALRKEEDARRQVLLAATRERKKYETLKEKQRRRHYETAETAMVKDTDETAINTYRQKKKNSAP